MGDEYGNSVEEYTTIKEDTCPQEENDERLKEYFEPHSEYWDVKDNPQETMHALFSDDYDRKLKQKKSARDKKLIKNMVFAVAAGATVAVMSQTIALPDRVDITDTKTEMPAEDETVQTKEITQTIIFHGTGELTREEVEAEFAKYYLDGGVQAVIEEGYTVIGEYAFDGYDELLSVTIPDSVTSIEQKAFAGCSNLNIITTAGSAAEQYAAAENIAYTLK